MRSLSLAIALLLAACTPQVISPPPGASAPIQPMQPTAPPAQAPSAAPVAPTRAPELPGPQRAAEAVARTLPIIAPRLAQLGAQAGDPIFMRAYKSEAILELWIQPRGRGRYVRFAAWPICAASGVLGPKLREGDRQVPEGFYAIPASAMNNASDYHLSMDTGYPNAFDRALGRTGSEIMVHGRCASIGCLAMTDPVIEQVWTLVVAAHSAGQTSVPIHIFPFAMTDANLAAQAGNPNLPFWRDLKVVHYAFEATRAVPEVAVATGRYRLGAH